MLCFALSLRFEVTLNLFQGLYFACMQFQFKMSFRNYRLPLAELHRQVTSIQQGL
ncbi:hypothetical protein OKW21_005441 [Catalinimonas alkaloidigena]|nr:hypothetical protein [Catalinimonas alkaloidigena]